MLRKIFSPQMIGVAPVRLGVASFQVMFSSWDHFRGRFFSADMPLRDGPLHCGQLSPEAVVIETEQKIRKRRLLLRIRVSPIVEFEK
jgi:hypothetical protein